MMVVTAAMVSLCGCATFGRYGSPRSVTVKNVYDDYDYAELQTQVTQEAVRQLRTAPIQDIPQAYRAFRERVVLMEGAGERLIAHADGIYSMGRSYFMESEKSGEACDYPRLRSLEGTRPAQLGEYFGPLALASREVKHAYRAYHFDMKQLKEYLCSNCNARGIDAVTFLFRKSEADVVALQDALEEALVALEQARNSAAPGAPAAPGQQGGQVAPPEQAPPAGT